MREALLDAAFEALLDEGPHFPASSVARRAEASKALIFHHFKSREGLLDAMAERVLSETQAGLDALADEYDTPRKRLVAFARALLAEPTETPVQATRVLMFWLADDRAKLRDDLLADFIERNAREARVKTNPEALARALLARWHGATVLYSTGRRVDFETESDKAAAELGEA